MKPDGKMVRRLNTLSDLRESKFGQPEPRHGLKLLWWFATQCVWIDSNRPLKARCNPANGDFGFHRFFNKERLLPFNHQPYYAVGNLKYADLLPCYVTKNNYRNVDSNADRIIVSYNSTQQTFKWIYVTRHSDESRFDSNDTFQISVDLLKDVQNSSLENFLQVAIQVPRKNPETLNELSELKRSRFGQPHPHRGLRLLFWFARLCGDITDTGIIALSNPANGKFGFHSFNNQDQILPVINLPYYEFGNLLLGLNSLPGYITKFYNGYDPNSNKDRIVVSVDSKWGQTIFRRIYVTKHMAGESFDANSTFRISRGLIKTIQGLKWKDFISKTYVRNRKRRR